MYSIYFWKIIDMYIVYVYIVYQFFSSKSHANPRMFNGAIFDLAEKPYIPQKILL